MTDKKTQEDYFKLSVKGLAAADEDLASLYWFERGAQGVAQELEFRQVEDNYDPITVDTEHIDLNVFFLVRPSYDDVEDFKLRFSGCSLEVVSEKSRDWLEEWKKGFHAFELISGTWVVPSWLEPPAEARSVISIDPGMAFGTGTHNTTQLCAHLLESLRNSLIDQHRIDQPLSQPFSELARSARAEANKGLGRVLDVGTGTGILAVLAEQMGAQWVVGNDIDAVARQVARENIEKNLPSGRGSVVNISDQSLKEIVSSQEFEPFDVVIANIIDGVLTVLREDLLRATAAGGRLVVSGILEERESIFRKNWQDYVEFEERQQSGEWLGFVLRPL